jgi:hypothetical protein
MLIFVKKMIEEVIHIAQNNFAIQANETDFIEILAAKINYLILNDFNKLISILYRADIDEKKLNHIFEENKNEYAGKLIAHLFIERQLQKIKSREVLKGKINTDSEEEKW